MATRQIEPEALLVKVSKLVFLFAQGKTVENVLPSPRCIARLEVTQRFLCRRSQGYGLGRSALICTDSGAPGNPAAIGPTRAVWGKEFLGGL